jgi:hypothetical protein
MANAIGGRLAERESPIAQTKEQDGAASLLQMD